MKKLLFLCVIMLIFTLLTACKDNNEVKPDSSSSVSTTSLVSESEVSLWVESVEETSSEIKVYIEENSNSSGILKENSSSSQVLKDESDTSYKESLSQDNTEVISSQEQNASSDSWTKWH